MEKDLKYDTRYKFIFRGWNELGPGLNSSEVYFCQVYPTTNMTASYNGSKVDFKWAQIEGSTFKSGLIHDYEIKMWTGSQCCVNFRFFDRLLNASIEMG